MWLSQAFCWEDFAPSWSKSRNMVKSDNVLSWCNLHQARVKGAKRNWYLGNNEGKIECLHNKGKENLTWKSWSHWLEEWKHKSLPRTVCSDLAFSSASQRLSKKCEHGQNGKKRLCGQQSSLLGEKKIIIKKSKPHASVVKTFPNHWKVWDCPIQNREHLISTHQNLPTRSVVIQFTEPPSFPECISPFN